MLEKTDRQMNRYEDNRDIARQKVFQIFRLIIKGNIDGQIDSDLELFYAFANMKKIIITTFFLMFFLTLIDDI